MYYLDIKGEKQNENSDCILFHVRQYPVRSREDCRTDWDRPDEANEEKIKEFCNRLNA